MDKLTGKLERESGHVTFAEHSGVTAVKTHNRHYDGQTQSRTLGRILPGGICPIEAIKQTREMFARDNLAGVRDVELRAAR